MGIRTPIWPDISALLQEVLYCSPRRWVDLGEGMSLRRLVDRGEEQAGETENRVLIESSIVDDLPETLYTLETLTGCSLSEDDIVVMIFILGLMLRGDDDMGIKFAYILPEGG
jgi:hypothetical protein